MNFQQPVSFTKATTNTIEALKNFSLTKDIPALEILSLSQDVDSQTGEADQDEDSQDLLDTQLANLHNILAKSVSHALSTGKKNLFCANVRWA